MEEKILKVLAEAGKVIKQLANAGNLYSPKRCFYDIKK